MGTDKGNKLDAEAPETKTDTLLEEEIPSPKGSDAAAKPAAGETKQDDEAEAKHKQQLDQERANARRARAALQESEAEREALAEQLETMQGQLAEMQSQLKQELTTKEYKELADLDPETTDVPDLVKAFQTASSKIQKLEEQNAQMAAYIAEQKSHQQRTQQLTARQQMEEEIYSTCDEEFGAQFRTEAVKLSDEWVDEGTVDPPRTPVQGLRLMRKAYAEVAKKHAVKTGTPTKKTVPTDTGLHGLSVTDLEETEEFKPGTLEEVAADIKRKIKAGKWNANAFGPS